MVLRSQRVCMFLIGVVRLLSPKCKPLSYPSESLFISIFTSSVFFFNLLLSFFYFCFLFVCLFVLGQDYVFPSKSILPCRYLFCYFQLVRSISVACPHHVVPANTSLLLPGPTMKNDTAANVRGPVLWEPVRASGRRRFES